MAKAFRRAIDDATRVNGLRRLAGDSHVRRQYRRRWWIRWRNCSSPTRRHRWWNWPNTPSSASRIRWSRSTTRTARSAASSVAWANCICKACTMARPDPAELAERLFGFETTLTFRRCAASMPTPIAMPSARTGLRRYRELAQAEWRKLKPRAAKDGYDSHRARSRASWSGRPRPAATSMNWWRSSRRIFHPGLSLSRHRRNLDQGEAAGQGAGVGGTRPAGFP